ncbi:MAG TPA: VOC family protein [Acidimicrobiia bacterium]|nr:VOC family protein [Acidimicrobiia bacterium]
MANVEVTQMRLVVDAADFEEAVGFYRDALGMRELESYSGEGGAEVMILDAGRATLELSNPAQIEFIDQVEVGERVAPHLRVAFEVADTRTATQVAISAGAELIAEPVETPWLSLNSRLDGPAGLQLTLFEELDEQGTDEV